MPTRDVKDTIIETVGAVVDELLARVPLPAYVVSGSVEDEAAACTVRFASPTSIEPPRFTLWLPRASRMGDVAARSVHLAVHALGAPGPAAVTPPRAPRRRLVQLHDDEAHELRGIAWQVGPRGVPVLEGCDWFVGSIVERLRMLESDHDGYVLEPIAGSVRRGDRVLVAPDVPETGHAA